MNKKDLKNSLKQIKPDPYLETRLNAKIQSHSVNSTVKSKKLTVSTAVLCAAIIVLSVSAGIGLQNIPHDTTNVSLSNNYAPETASVDVSQPSSDLVEILNSQKESKSESGNYVAYSVPTIETNYYHKQVLLVNGKDIAPEYYVNFDKIKNYTLLPFTAILEELGATTQWQTDTTAIITLNGVKYNLDAEKCTLKADGSDVNLLVALENEEELPGDIPMFTIYDGEFVLDNYTTQGALKALGFKHKVTVNYDKEIATIQ